MSVTRWDITAMVRQSLSDRELRWVESYVEAFGGHYDNIDEVIEDVRTMTGWLK